MKIRTFLTTTMMTLMVSMTAFASQKVTSVSVKISETKTEPGIIYEAEPTVSSSKYEITDMTVSKDYDNWKPGKKVTFSVTIEPTDGYSFDTKKIKKVSVSNGTAASESIKSGKITLKINYIPKVILEDPQNIYFEDEYLAVWDKVDYCSQYEVNILKEDDDENYKSYKTVKVKKPEIDLSSYATDYYGITFKVRAIPEDSDESKYLKSSDWVSADDCVYSDDNTSYGNFTGSDDNLKFKAEDGYASGWQKLNGYWYYFNANNGNKAITSSWAKINGTWYLFNEYGIMQTGWVKSNGYWYFLNPSTDAEGAMMTGWVLAGPDGPWYYLQPGTNGPLPEGAMYTDMTTPDGYYVNSDGEWWS